MVLVHMPSRKTDLAASASAGALNAIPASLRTTTTSDQGKEMANHESVALNTGMRFFTAERYGANKAHDVGVRSRT